MTEKNSFPRRFASLPPKQGLYDPAFEHDSCGVGFVAHIKGQRSHQILLDAREVLHNMDHRGACGCEPNTGDGAGILTALPHEFLERVVREELGAELPPPGQFAAGIVFLPTHDDQRAKCKKAINDIIAAEGQRLVGWRKVPTETEKADIGPTAKAGEPHIEQLVIAAGGGLVGDAFDGVHADGAFFAVGGQEDEAGAVFAGGGQIDVGVAFGDLYEELVGQAGEDAGAVAGVLFTAAGSAMVHVF